MRETQTETKLTEEEVELIYCDECGTECSDEFRVKPTEVCVSCSDETTVTKAKDMMSTEENDSDGLEIHILFVLIALYPLFLALFWSDDSISDDKQFTVMLVSTLATAVWTMAITYLIFGV